MLFNSVVTNDLQGNRGKVLDYLRGRNLKVLDVGGAMGSWADEVVTAYADINADQYLKEHGKKLFCINISDYETWASIHAHVHMHGMFDFAVCTQTLEDIQCPSVVLKMLPRVAKMGYIDVPSKYMELKPQEFPSDPDREIWGIDGHILGYTGHRWIMSLVQDEKLIMCPKLPFVEHMRGLDWWDKTNPPGYHYCFWWKDGIAYEIVNNDFLGPNPPSVYNAYREALRAGL
jgi:hypothetical protein